MNILLLTSLYPDFKSTTYHRQTKALHHFAKFWVKEETVEVLVVKMHFYPRDEDNLSPRKNYILDEVPIVHNFQFDKSAFRLRNFRLRLLPFYLNVGLGSISMNEYNQNSLLKILEQHSFNPDIILGHSMLTYQPASSLSDEMDIPFVLGMHRSDVLNWTGHTKWVEYIDQYVRKANGIVFRSPSLKLLAEEEKFLESKQSFVAVSGIKDSWLVDEEEALQKLYEWKIGSRPVRFISVCNLQKLKNLDINLHVLNRLRDRFDFTYEIIGDGEERSYLESLTQSLGLSKLVIFHGRLEHDQVLDKLRTSDIFLMISKPETFGLAYLEAIAGGNLVIAARGQGIDGLFQEDEVFFTPAGDQNALYDKLVNDLLMEEEKILKKRLLLSMKRASSLNERKVAMDYLSFIKSIYIK